MVCEKEVYLTLHHFSRGPVAAGLYNLAALTEYYLAYLDVTIFACFYMW